jgi:hypothetical protein
MRGVNRRASIAIVALAGAPACSLLVVDGPPPAEVRRDTDFACTTSRAVPIADLVAVTAVAIHEGADIGNNDREWTGLALSHEHHSLLTAGVITAFAASAFVGFTRVEACREARAERERERQLQGSPNSTPRP